MSFRKITVYALLLSLFVTSCTISEEVQTTSSEPSYSWTAEFYTPEVDIAAATATSDGEYVYFTTAASSSSASVRKYTEYYRWKIGEGEPEKLNITGTITKKHSDRTIIQPDGYGNLYIVFPGMYISKHDSDGNELFFETADIPSFIHTAVDSEGRLFVSGKNHFEGEIYIFNTDCTLASKLTDTQDLITSAQDGTVYSASSISGEVIYNAVTSDEVYKNCGKCTDFVSYLEEGFLMNLYENLYLYNTATESLELLFTWANLGVDYNDVKSFCVLDDGSIAAFLCAGEINSTAYQVVHIVRTESKKTVITLGTFYTNAALLNAVAEFNKSNSEYRVEIKQYYDSQLDNTVGGTGYQDAVTKFHLDIASGSCPDILCLDYDDLAAYASKDLFEDLSPYFEKSGLELIGNIKESCTINGKLVSAVPIMEVRAFACRSDDMECAEEINSWTLDELMDYVRSHPDEPVFDVGAEKMLEYCLTFNQSRFVDFDSFTCSFESEDFYRLLEFCKGYYGGDNNINAYPGFNISYHDALLYEVRIITPSDYVMLRQLLKNESISFFGFPTDSGSGILIKDWNGCYSISSVSEKKDAAWSFIEAFMKTVPSFEFLNFKNGFPTDRMTRETFFTEAMKDPYAEHTDENGNTYFDRTVIGVDGFTGELCYFYVPFEDELTPILSLIDIAEAPKDNDSTILNIILENAADYFDGEKSVEEVAKQIQSRVMLYLGEIK